MHVDVEGAPRPLPSPVDLAAFRIVQEALTNVTKHAGPAAAMVHVRYGDDELRRGVDDDGPPAGAPVAGADGTGSGLVGMRERAAALGGDGRGRAAAGWRLPRRRPRCRSDGAA